MNIENHNIELPATPRFVRTCRELAGATGTYRDQKNVKTPFHYQPATNCSQAVHKAFTSPFTNQLQTLHKALQAFHKPIQTFTNLYKPISRFRIAPSHFASIRVFRAIQNRTKPDEMGGGSKLSR